MPLQDEMTFQRIETLLDMRFKKLHEELKTLKDELGATRDEVRKLTQVVNERPAPEPAYQPQWQQPPQQQQAPPQQWQQAPPQYPQQGAYPQQAPANRYSGQFDAPSAPQAAPPQQAPPAASRNKWAPPPEKPASTEPIDRNGVAPAEAEKLFQNFFYMGGKKK